MRLDGERESENIEDRRGGGMGGGGFGGGGGGFGGGRVIPIGGGIGTIAIILICLFLGVDPSMLFSGGDQAPPQQTQTQTQTVPGRPSQQAENGAPRSEDPNRRFVSQILASTEDVWTDYFRQMGRTYQDPTLVLYSGVTRSGCGTAQAQIGPFYCPADHKLYLDMSFFQEMQNKLGAPGEFARAYVIAHEVGHHVQTLLGTMDRVAEARQGADRERSNAISVRVELQADCYAGIWANHANASRHILEQGDLESGIGAASAVGDDNLQRRSQGYVVPESFTHGSSAARVRWFRRGMETGDIRQCDTFNAQQL